MFNIRILNSIEEISVVDWDACCRNSPFGKHAFYQALEQSSAVGQSSLIRMIYIILESDNHEIVACAPGMMKWGTKREFGPENRWLREGLTNGTFNWPKFQIGTPYFPALNNKLMVKEGYDIIKMQKILIQKVIAIFKKSQDIKIFNMMNIDVMLAEKSKEMGALISSDVHSIWFNDNYKNMDDYLLRLAQRKRYLLRKERKTALSSGLEYKLIYGHELKDEVIQDYYDGHQLVCRRYGNQPWLSLKAYQYIVENLRNNLVMLTYMDGHKFIAGSIELNDNHLKVNYALQWSEMSKVDCIALDLICYRSIENAINQNLIKVESGITAIHKKLRGWDDVPVFNAHWFKDVALKNRASKIINKLKIGV